MIISLKDAIKGKMEGEVVLTYEQLYEKAIECARPLVRALLTSPRIGRENEENQRTAIDYPNFLSAFCRRIGLNRENTKVAIKFLATEDPHSPPSEFEVDQGALKGGGKALNYWIEYLRHLYKEHGEDIALNEDLLPLDAEPSKKLAESWAKGMAQVESYIGDPNVLIRAMADFIKSKGLKVLLIEGLVIYRDGQGAWKLTSEK